MSQQINLFNPIFRKQKKYLSSATMAQALAVICLACVLLALYAVNRKAALLAQAQATDAQLAAKTAKLADIKIQYAPRARSTTLGAELAAAQSELTLLMIASETIKQGGFGDQRGFSGHFRAFARQRVEGVWLTELTIGAGGTAIGVKGNTLNAELVPQYMQKLAQEPVMKGATFSTLAIGVPGVAAEPSAVQARPTAGAKVNYLQFSLQSALERPAGAAPAAAGGK